MASGRGREAGRGRVLPLDDGAGETGALEAQRRNDKQTFTENAKLVNRTVNTHQVSEIRQVNNHAASGCAVVKIVVPIAVVKIVVVIGVVVILLFVRFVLFVVRMINISVIKLDEGTVGRA